MTIKLAESHDSPVVEIFSDSTYVVDGINTRMDQWKAKGWKLLQQQTSCQPGDVERNFSNHL